MQTETVALSAIEGVAHDWHVETFRMGAVDTQLVGAASMGYE
jgi:hypothetical protein